MTTEAETLRQCEFRPLMVGWVPPYGRRCGEPIAQEGETWEHVDPTKGCGHVFPHNSGWNKAFCEADEDRPLHEGPHRGSPSLTHHPFTLRVVKRDHRAIPGEER